MAQSVSPWERFQRFLDRTESRWAFWILISSGSGGTLTAILAAVTEWLAVWGPIGWAIAFFAGAAVTAVIFWIGAYGYYRLAAGRQMARVIGESNVNPLEDNFERRVIRLVDFYHPLYLPHKNKTFRKCEITGPGLVWLSGVNANGCIFAGVQVVLVKEGTKIVSATGFLYPTLVDCYITNLTMLMSRPEYESLPQQLRNTMPVING